jgi:cytochrome c
MYVFLTVSLDSTSKGRPMKFTSLLASLILVALPTSSALASVELSTKNKCNTCHEVGKKKVGPSYKEIAAKNKGTKAEALADIIVKGNIKGGKYGKVGMPPQAAAKADAEALAKWILAQ